MEDIGDLAGEQLLFLVGQLEVGERRDALHIGGRQVSGHCGDRTWKRANGKRRGSWGPEAPPRFDLVIPVQGVFTSGRPWPEWATITLETWSRTRAMDRVR